MQVNSINLAQNFTGRRDNIDAYINLDDSTLRNVATLKTLQSIDTKKHKRIDNALMLALPLAGGLSDAVTAPKNFRKNAFLGGAATWGLYLAGISGAFGLINLAQKNSEAFNKFTEKHPLLTFAGKVITGLAAADLAVMGGSKAISKIGKSNAYKKIVSKAGNMFAKAQQNKLFNKSLKLVDKTKNFASSMIAKIPSALKGPLKWGAAFAPIAIMTASILHAINHSSVVSRTFAKNYEDLKEKQLQLAQKRNLELTLQNDFLLTNQQNIES